MLMIRSLQEMESLKVATSNPGINELSRNPKRSFKIFNF